MGSKLYKILNADGSPCNGGNSAWHLPKGSRPGKWMPRIKDPRCCKRGYHVCRAEHVLDWLCGDAVYVVEVRGDCDRREDKESWEQARLIKLVMDACAVRLFTADCAEKCLAFFEQQHPNDTRPRHAILAARKYAFGNINDAVRVAAWAATCGAARVWQRCRLKQYLEGRIDIEHIRRKTEAGQLVGLKPYKV